MYFLMLQEKGLVNKMVNVKKNLRSYKGMTVRNIKVYMKDKTAIMLSMITQVIVLGLYLLFLKNSYVDMIKAALEELGNIVSNNDINALVNSWLVAGVIGTSVVTVALNSLTIMVSDKQEKIDFDYNASPVKSGTVVMSYFSGAVASTFIISAILLTAGLGFIAISGSFVYTAYDILMIYGLVLLGSISATLILMLFASFFKKNSTLSSFGVMVSAAIGFVIGAYMPVSQFGEGVQTAVNLVPGSHIAALMRNVLMGPALDKIDTALDGIDKGLFAEGITNTFSFELNIFGVDFDINMMLVYSFIAIAVFFVLNLISYRVSSKRKD